jgi:hypothetical protein
MIKQFGIGEKIRIFNAGCVRSGHDRGAKVMGATCWERDRGEISGHINDGMIGEVTNKWKDLYLIRLEDGYDYVFSDGFELYEKIKKEIKPYGICEFVTKYYK